MGQLEVNLSLCCAGTCNDELPYPIRHLINGIIAVPEESLRGWLPQVGWLVGCHRLPLSLECFWIMLLVLEIIKHAKLVWHLQCDIT